MPLHKQVQKERRSLNRTEPGLWSQPPALDAGSTKGLFASLWMAAGSTAVAVPRRQAPALRQPRSRGQERVTRGFFEQLEIP